MRKLILGRKLHMGNGYCLAAWHWPWSLTWRWALYLHKRDWQVKSGLYFMGYRWYEHIVWNGLFISLIFRLQDNIKL